MAFDGRRLDQARCRVGSCREAAQGKLSTGPSPAPRFSSATKPFVRTQLRSARTRGPITFGHPTSRTALSARPSVDAVLIPGRLAERGVAIPGPGDYVRVW